MTVRLKRIAAQLVLALAATLLLMIAADIVPAGERPARFVGASDSAARSRPLAPVLPLEPWRHLP
ncbi:MAG: hypothetical protein AB7K67_01065 [Hyphomicrobiaceae bacterium]